MKTSAVLSSLLFGSFAAAAPFDRRALVYKTEVVTETVVVYTTVWDDEPVAQATTTPAGYFYEQPKAPSSVALKVTPTPQAPTEEKPTVAPKPATTPSPSPVPTPTPAPAPVVEQPKPVEEPKPTKEAETTAAPKPTTTTSAYVAPPAYTEAPASPAPAPSAPASGTPSTGGSMEHQNVDITIYDIASGQFGACGTPLNETSEVVALSKTAWGASTYDVMTGASTNPWCGQKISIVYEGHAPIEATIVDMCPGCTGPEDIDLSQALWEKVTGREKTRLKASWSKIN